MDRWMVLLSSLGWRRWPSSLPCVFKVLPWPHITYSNNLSVPLPPFVWRLGFRGFDLIGRKNSLNNLENWGKEVMWRSKIPLNHWRLVPGKVPKSILHRMASDPLEMIFRIFYSREKGNCRCDIMRSHGLIHDFLREWLGVISWRQIRGSFPGGTSTTSMQVLPQFLICFAQLLIGLCVFLHRYPRRLDFYHQTILQELLLISGFCS